MKIHNILFIALSLFLMSRPSAKAISIVESLETEFKTDTFIVCGNCYTCKVRIHGVLEEIDGLQEFNWDYSEILHIIYDNSIISPVDFLQAIADVGHDTELIQAPRNAYTELIGTCCEYERWLTYDSQIESWEVQGTNDCSDYIAETLLDLHGITDGNWINNSLSAEYFTQINNKNNILLNMALAGFDNEIYTASVEAYNTLPEGCQYRTTSKSEIYSNTLVKKIYPVPANDQITLMGDFSSITHYSLYSIDGKLIKNFDFKNESNEITLNTNNLHGGQYFILIKGENLKETIKFIKE